MPWYLILQRVAQIAMRIRIRRVEAVKGTGVGTRDGARARNMWALGLALSLCGRAREATEPTRRRLRFGAPRGAR